MDGLTLAIQRCNLRLKLDNQTEGQGNCFPNAIVQQCRRPEVKAWLKINNPLAIFSGQEWVRIKVTNFALKSRHSAICDLKKKYEMEIQEVEQKTWNDYWTQMAKDGTWVDHMFVQVTAWFMRLDIMILTTSSLPNSPFILIDGNISNISGNMKGPSILLGNYTNIHYQSLIEDNTEKNTQTIQTLTNLTDIDKEDQRDNFIYMQDGQKMIFKTKNNTNFECPVCNIMFTRIVNHVNSKNCQISRTNIDKVEFKAQLDSFREGYRLELNRKRIQRSRKKSLIEKGSDQIKKEQNERKTKSRDNLLVEKGPSQIRKEQNEWKIKSKNKLFVEKGPQQIKKEQNERKAKSRDNLLVEKGPSQIRKEQQEWRIKSKNKLFVEKGPQQIKKEQNERKAKSRDNLLVEKGPSQIRKEQKEWRIKSKNKFLVEKGQQEIKKKQNERKTKSRDNLLVEKGPLQIMKEQNAWKMKSRGKLLVEKGPLQIRKEQNEWKIKSREKLMNENGPLQNREQNNKWKLQSRKRKLKDSPEELLNDERRRKQKSRLIDSDKKRLKKFKERTMFNAIFTCSSCQRNLFDCNVCILDEKLITEIRSKNTGLIERAIESNIKININGKVSSYICHACKKHLKRGKLPPMSAKNGLKMHKLDSELDLTELEGSLISRSIVFMKIFQLPKSRWTALKDKVVNVPVNEDDIINTITRLPRTPNEAGLIEVDLKRKVEYQNSHLKQLISPQKCYKMLELLKRSGNPYYQFYDDYNTYSHRCKQMDKKGYLFVFDEDIEKILDISEKRNEKAQTEEENSCIEEILENDYLKNDPVRKYQFDDYNKSLCMSNMFPESNPGNSVIVAPGEGKTPKNVLNDDDWDIKAFPHLNSPDGKYGLHYDRETRLSSQYYFVQRICNQNQKFARSPAYVYAAVGHTELQQLQRNINLSYSRGKETASNEGIKTLKLDDPYAVLDNIKQTPRYWRKSKYEMFAKLDNFGPFHFFFTLSCADLRWNENFAAILRAKEFSITYEFEEDQDGYPKTVIYVEDSKNGSGKIPLQKYITENIDESLHECIRGNVLLATRYFNHRVKAFINNIIMGGGNPMMVDKFSYKTEFQDRGAGHVHGVLWVKLYKIEKLCRLEDNNLVTLSKEQKNDMNGKYSEPFKGIESAFRKFRTQIELNEDEEQAVVNFVDQFTTVSLCADEVGREVVRIVEEVNKHHHTKTCKPKPKCRFRYPKFPVWKTVLVKPYKCEFNEEREHYLKKYANTLSKVHEKLEEKELIDSIMSKFSKKEENKEEYNINRKLRILELLKEAEVSEGEYFEALSWSRTGYSIHLKRDMDEIYINSYDPEWIRAWDGNIDKQPVFDFFEVITYVTEYFTKDESGTAEVLKKVVEDNPDDCTKEKMKKIASTFLSHRQIGEAEAFYKLLPDLLLKNSNVTCQWLPLGSKNERYIRMKRVEEDSNKDKNLLKIEGVEGLWYEQPDILSKYKRRDDQLEKMCYTHYGKMIRSGGKYSEVQNEGPDEDNYGEDSGDEDGRDDNSEDPNAKFHYIITEEDSFGPEIPKFTKLTSTLPNENPIQYKRSFPAALRFHKVNKDNHPHKFFLSELMLYIHFREEDEFQPDNPAFIEDMYIRNQERIRKIKSKVMEHLHDVEEARYYVEEANKKLDLTEIGITLDAAAEQENAECNEEIEELHPDYLHLDTEYIDNKEERAEMVQNIYRKIDLPDIKMLKQKTRQLDPFQRNVIDIGIKFVKDIIKSEGRDNPLPAPPYIMVHGGAGAGKSHAIESLAEWVQISLQKSGDDIDSPYVIKTAFTGAAASLIEGMTLHSAFGFEFGNKHYSLSDKIRDARKNSLKNLKVLIIDEISMVKADMLYQLDLRLQEIKEKIGVPFGGVSIFCFGDIMQLQPVCGKYIFDRPSNPSFFITHELDSLWNKFRVLNLELNHRQGNDKDYADMLNRVRVGEQTKADINQLKERIRPYGHSDLKEVSHYIVCKKVDCGRINSEYLEKHTGKEFIIKAIHFHKTQKKYKPPICKKEGTIGTSSFMDLLKIKIGCKVILIHNIDTSDGLTNGQLGILIATVKADDGSVSKCIVEFKKQKIGTKNRANNQQYAAKYPSGTVIEKVSYSYPISRKATSASTHAVLVQFPLKVAHAITAHKIQGQTIAKPLKIALDISSVFDDGQAHVMLSRGEELEQIYVLNKLEEDKIRASKKALKELEKMNERSLNQNPIPWKQENESFLKIATLNCMNLKANYEDILCDRTLLQSLVIALSETWLEKGTELQIDGYIAHFNSIGPGKGLAVYLKDDRFKKTVTINLENMQMLKLKSQDLDFITVYRSERGNSTELLQHIKDSIDENSATLISGDFNICYKSHRNNKITKFLETSGFKQLITEATHIKGRQIDHLYFKPGKKINANPIIYRYSPYYSDHDAICVTLTRTI